jgi:hypothetical protein
MKRIERRKGQGQSTVVAGVLALGAWTGCGGSTGALPAGDGGTDGATAATPADASGEAAAAPFNPGMIGGLLGAGAGADGAAPLVGDAAPSPQVVDGCTRLCTAEAAAACSASGTLQSCIVGCQLLVGNPSCATQTQALFACTDGKTAACDQSGNATFAGCGVQELESEACFLQNATDPALQTPCATYCAGVTAAKCPNDDPSGCAAACPVLGNLVPGCDGSWKDYVECADTATFTCGSDGKASAAGCTVQALTFFVCLATGVAPLVTDAGVDQ